MATLERLLRAGAAALVVAVGACVVFDGKLGYDPTPGIPCLGDTCGPGTSCCVAPGMVGGGWFGDMVPCSAAPACTNGDFSRLSCATPFDCNAGSPQGKVCCAQQLIGMQVTSSSCTAPDECSPAADHTVLVLCNPKDSTPCPGGGKCQPVMDVTVLPAGFSACQ